MRFVGCLLIALAGCRPPTPSDRLLTNDVGPVNTSALAASDFLEVRVYQEPDLSGVFRVSPDGDIDYPLCGRVHVAGLTPGQTANSLSDCLKTRYLKRPQVSVMVKEFNSKKVFVFGDVSKPGAFPFEEGMTIVQALSQAGGFNRTASKNAVNVVRVRDGKETKLPVRVDDIVNGREKNFAMLPGDIVFVPEGFL